MAMSSRKIDPLGLLPYEIWARCLWLYARDQPDGPLPLLAVSKAWEESLLAAPEIWTTVYLDGSSDEACRAACFFYLSGRLPMEVVKNIKSLSFDVIVKYRDRIKVIVFLGDTNQGDSNFLMLHTLALTSDVYFLNLTHIYAEFIGVIEIFVTMDLILACPALVSVHGAYIVHHTGLLASPSITSLDIYVEYEFGRGFGDHLEALGVRCGLKTDEVLPSHLFTANTTKLKHLELEFGWDSYKLWLENSVFSVTNRRHYLARIQEAFSHIHYGLQTLRINLPWMDLYTLFPRLSACHGLRELSLIVDCSVKGPEAGTPVTKHDIGHIRKLFMSTTPREQPDTAIVSVLHSLAAEEALLDLQELKLELPDIYISQVLNLLRTTRRLQVLHLTDFKQLVSNAIVSEPVRLYYLYTLVVQYGNALYCLEAPNLICFKCLDVQLELYPLPYFLISSSEYITIPSFLLYQWNDALVIKNVKTKPLPRLLTLEITPEYDRMDPVSPLNYSNLSSISFKEKTGTFTTTEQAKQDSSLTRFMLDMLFSPENCPKLHTIKSNMYPNWALTAAMLHRRNSTNSVTHIESFWLPGCMQINLLETVIWALKSDGDDPTDGILVAAEMDHIMLQRWELPFCVTTCQDCIKLGYLFCIDAVNKSPPDDPEHNSILDLVPPFPDSTRLGKFTREDWETHLEQTAMGCTTEDPISCHRHNRNNLVNISSHILSGINYDAF